MASQTREWRAFTRAAGTAREARAEARGAALAGSHETADRRLPLFVNLDGTLTRNALLFEGILRIARKRPILLLLFPWWLLQGRGVFRTRIADHADIDAEVLPYRPELLAYLRSEAAAGRELHLIGAADERYVRKVSQHLGIFRTAHGSTGSTHLSGGSKLRRMAEASGGQPFAYAGSTAADLPLWKGAAQAVVVDASPTLKSRAGGVASVAQVFPRVPASLKDAARALRLHQWLKNTLIFVPLFTSQHWRDVAAWQACFAAFVAFGMVASATYIFNDFMDLGADRRHPSKRTRPFASGRLSIARGLVWMVALLGAGLAGAFVLSAQFGMLTLAYLTLTVAYSVHLKTYMLLDATVLAVLYTLRIIAGASVVAVEMSTWLLAFSIFLFFSLAMMKRCAELLRMIELHRTTTHGRDYRVTDLESFRSMGIASGYLAVLVLALYADSDAARILYTNPKLLWLWCLIVLYWVSRLWIKTARGEMHDDPVVYSARDTATWLIAGLMGAVMLLAL